MSEQDKALDNLMAWQQEFDKPVAWMIIDVDNGKSLQFKENKFSEINIPLYTAPKELSDEEIIETVKDHFIGAMKLGIVLTHDNVIDFARAILKKASEK